MRVLVTGGAGFIGANLIRKLLSQGNEVICIDNFASGLEENIKELFNNNRFFLIVGNIVDKALFDKIGRVDQIYNLACLASPKYYQKQPIETLRTCFEGVLNVLEYARKYNVRILQTSTSEVYGDPLVSIQSEKYYGNVNPNGVRGCYDEGKRVAETLCCDYLRMYDIDIKIARIFNTYGPYMRPDDGWVISNFVNAVLRDESIKIYGDGKQTRSMCYVTDMVDGLILLMNSNVHGPVNLGNPEELTINEVVSIVMSQMNKIVPVKHVQCLEDDPQKRCPDISLAKKELSWQPLISFDVGITKTIEYYKSLK